MPPQSTEERLAANLKSLVAASLQARDDEGDEERIERGNDLALEIIAQHEEEGDYESYDIGQIGDLIKKKLWREYNAPDKAVQFGNLYSRFVGSPVLGRKHDVLRLLYSLAAPSDDDEREDSPEPAEPQINHNTRARESELQGKARGGLNDASSSRVNQRNPHQERGTTNRREAPQPDAVLESEDYSPAEPELLRDLPFTLQGLSSTNLPFESHTTLNLPSSLPLPIVSLLNTLAEPSLLYKSLQQFVRSQDEGLVAQSLRATIGIELRSYLGLIATLEGEIRRAITTSADSSVKFSTAKLGVSLKRIVVWTRDATMGLRLMSLIAEESKNKRGGQLITLVHSFYTSYGDPFVSAFAERMLSSLTRPFYDMLRQWIYDGELSDPYNEFFVIEADPDNETYRDLDPKQIAAASVWENKYKLNQRLVPSIISDELAKKIFLIGKSLNFIRYSCGDASWVEAYSKDASRELKYGDTATLESSIDKAYKTTMARLLHLMNDKFQLLRHLRAMKSYLLLSQGDFVALLMEAVAKNLEKPAVAQYRHTLTAALDHAIRGSNAHFEAAETLSHLDARLLELSHGDIGWDVFTLDYRIDAPVDVVVTTWASKQYLSVFNFLWRIKRVEHALGSSWQRTTTGARGVLKTVGKDLEKDWKTVRCCIGEMVHFVNQLQYYILFEVIEASWNELQVAFTKPDSTLDDLITAHTSYIKGITHKGLLGGEKSMLTGNKDESFLSQLHFLLKLMLSYKDAVDGLYSFCVAEFTRQQETAAKIETRTAAGKWGVTESNDYDDRSSPVFGMRRGGTRTSEVESPITAPNWLTTANDDQMLPSLRKRLEELSKEFRNRVELLLGDLRAQEDVELKFLGVVMNFNDVYMPGSRKKEKEFEKGKDVVVGERDREKKGRRGKDKSVSLMDTPSTVRTVRGMR